MAIGAKQRSVSMLPEDIKIVQEHGEPMSLDFSTSLRLIIREWQEMKRMRVVGIDSLPRPAGATEVPVILVRAEPE